MIQSKCSLSVIASGKNWCETACILHCYREEYKNYAGDKSHHAVDDDDGNGRNEVVEMMKTKKIILCDADLGG